MAPPPDLGHTATMKRIKTNIRDKRTIKNRDLDIMQEGDSESFNQILELMDNAGIIVNPKYRTSGSKASASASASKVKPPSSKRKRPEVVEVDESESDMIEVNQVKWTGKQDKRFIIQTQEEKVTSFNDMDYDIAIGVNKMDPEPQRIVVASFDTRGYLKIEAISISSEGKEFEAHTGYKTLSFTIGLQQDTGKLKQQIEFRKEIDTATLMHSMRRFVWNELIQRGNDPTYYGWSDPNDDVAKQADRGRELVILRKELKATDSFGFMTYRKQEHGKQILQSALQLAAITTEPFQEIVDLKLYLSNPTDTEEYAVQLYESARIVIDKIMQEESGRRINVLMIRSGYHKFEPDLTHPIDWNAIPYAMESTSPIINDKKAIFELPATSTENIQKEPIDDDQETDLPQDRVKKAIAYIEAKGDDRGNQKLMQTVLRAMISIETVGGNINDHDTIESMISAMGKDVSRSSSADGEDD
jgi:hypothetical protein